MSSLYLLLVSVHPSVTFCKPLIIHHQYQASVHMIMMNYEFHRVYIYIGSEMIFIVNKFFFESTVCCQKAVY